MKNTNIKNMKNINFKNTKNLHIEIYRTKFVYKINKQLNPNLEKKASTQSKFLQ